MLRSVLHSFLAFFLLLCLLRTLLPEAWVLALHAHEHTTEELTFAPSTPSLASQRQAAITPKHTHCHEKTFYNVPFQGAAPVAVPLPRVQLRYQALVVPATLANSAAQLRRSALRGPPAA